MNPGNHAREFVAYVLAAMLGTAALEAQVVSPEQNIETHVTTERSGLRLQSVAAFITYYSIVPEILFRAPSGMTLGSEERVGGSATVEYSHFTEKSALSMVYSPSYIAGIQYSGWNAANHYVNLNWRRKLTGRWRGDATVSAVVTSANEVLFMPTTLASVAAVPASFDDLVSAVLAGRFNNNQLASILTGASALDSPAAMLIYGDRVLVSLAQVGAAYSHSSRTLIHFRGSATRMQFLKGTGGPEASGYVLPQTTTGTASVSVSHSFSPRTYLGVEASTSRTMSRVQDAYRSSTNVSVGRIMGRRWFAQARGGVGFVTAVRRTYDLPGGAQYQVGGDIGYKTHAHTFMASAMRLAGDSYGFGATSSTSITGAWNWNRPGSAWLAGGNFGQERLAGAGFKTFTSWRATAGIGRTLGGHTSVFAQYGFMDYSGLTGPAGKPINQHVVRVAVIWTPGGRR